MMTFIFAIPEVRMVNVVVFIGILFCGVGDTLLMLENMIDDGFLYGMLAFAVGHILYCLAVSLTMTMDFTLGKIILLLPVIIILLKSFPKYYKKLGKMRNYVFIYITVSLLLNFLIVCGVNFSEPQSFLLYVGSVFFIFSDSLIAIVDLGKNKIFNGRLYIMSTYISAQFLIASGILFY